ncbi:carbohydrate ABC transporter permease [Athalassotoga saccharophila]|uniref:carbohydrate ABC transporter permease n=1 Tax=Athalassotoga saccharophila TaxID=1441386 RepID=UPI0013798E4C|nr:sugar ABC transporter permease [Athalassotoga saccharophila]BBJ28036.1 maltodextrin ABC transporter, permease protein MdxF [Athalassotoga saccharophila]
MSKTKNDPLHKSDPYYALIFIIPTLAVIAFVAFWPLAQTFYNSLYKSALMFPQNKIFVGLSNYGALWQDPRFVNDLWNTIRFTAWSVGIETVLGVLVALMLNKKFKLRGLVRAAVLVPWAIPTVVSSEMWRWMYNDNYGVINSILMSLHVIKQPIVFLAFPSTAMPAIISVDVWKTTPFMVLLILAGLQLIPEELYEAARIDGANAWQRFWSVTFPMIRPTIGIALIFRSLDAMRVFDIVFIMTKGAANTETLSVYNQWTLFTRGFIQPYFGYGSAMSVMIFLIIGILAIFYVKMMKIRLD